MTRRKRKHNIKRYQRNNDTRIKKRMSHEEVVMKKNSFNFSGSLSDPVNVMNRFGENPATPSG